jgi:hypothetical protein
MSKRIEGEVRWCILRTAGPRTLSLAKSLTDVGMDAWTPVAKVTRRLSRKPVWVHYDAPFTPTHVFVRIEHLAELEQCRAMPINPHPAFSIFRPYGKTAEVTDAQLAPLRAIEERSRQVAEKRKAVDERGTAEPYTPGEAVKIEGAFTGLTPVVAASDRRWTEVVIAPGFSLKIDTSQLRRLNVSADAAE